MIGSQKSHTDLHIKVYVPIASEFLLAVITFITDNVEI